MFQVGERKRSRRPSLENPSSRRRLSIESIAENGPLKGAVVCLTGLSVDEKTRLHEFVEQLGGSYTRDLDTAKNTHLIAQEPEGAKYDTAIASSRIRVVSPAWLDECVKSGTRADETQYMLKRSRESDENNFPPLEQEIEELLESNNRSSLFEYCRFLLLGFEADSDLHVKLSRLIRRGKGTIYWELNEIITHVIVEDDCDEVHRDNARTISLHHPNGPAAISPFWIVSSWKDGSLAPTLSFPPRKTVVKQAPKKKVAKSGSIKGKRQSTNLFQGSVFVLLRSSPPEGAVEFHVKELEANITSHGGQLLSPELLEALRADKASQDTQLRNCYVVCWGGYTPAHMMVHPLLSRVEKEKLCVVLPVTPIWLYSCSSDGKLIKPNKNPTLFQPQSWSIRRLPDSKQDKQGGIKVSVTGFVGSERAGIIQALRVIGSTYTENLPNTNTHLICKESKGAKYEKAVKWGLCVVSVEWLYHVMEHGYCGNDGDGNKGCENKFSMVPTDTPLASDNDNRKRPSDDTDDETVTKGLSQTNTDGGMALENDFEPLSSQEEVRDTVDETQQPW